MQEDKKKWPLSTIILFWLSVAFGAAAGIGSAFHGYSILQVVGSSIAMFVGMFILIGLALSHPSHE